MRLLHFLILPLLLLVSISRAQIIEDGQDTHGGSHTHVEIYKKIETLGKDLQRIPAPLLRDYSHLPRTWSQKLVITEIRIETELSWNNQRVLAINHPLRNPPLLQINGPYWLEPLSDQERDEVLLHEFISLLGYRDTYYQHSRYLMNLLNLSKEGQLTQLFEEGTRLGVLNAKEMAEWSLYIETNKEALKWNAVKALLWVSEKPQLLTTDLRRQLFQWTLEITPRAHYCSPWMNAVLTQLKNENTPSAKELLSMLRQKGVPKARENFCL